MKSTGTPKNGVFQGQRPIGPGLYKASDPVSLNQTLYISEAPNFPRWLGVFVLAAVGRVENHQLVGPEGV